MTEPKNLEGIGGWLALLAVGQWIGLLGVFTQFGKTTDPAEQAAMVMFGIAQVVVIILLHSKHHLFRNVYLGVAGVSALLTIVGMFALTSPEEIGGSIGSLIGVAIWSAYVYRSERVANTFVR